MGYPAVCPCGQHECDMGFESPMAQFNIDKLRWEVLWHRKDGLKVAIYLDDNRMRDGESGAIDAAAMVVKALAEQL